MKTRVWFNHWFSTAYDIISLMREAFPDELEIIGTNRSDDSPISLMCDEWYKEPTAISDEEYVSFCLDFCREHNIDIFVPRRAMGIIGANGKRFEEIGVKLLTDAGNEYVGIFADKLETYIQLADIIPEFIPEYYEIGSVEDFVGAYEKITAVHERACFKFAADEGAVSFRVIDNTIEDRNALTTPPGLKMTYEKAKAALSDLDFRRRLIMMPYLKGVEISADCLATDSGNIIIPRYKYAGRIYTIRRDPEIVECCERILERSGLKMPCNIQFKCMDDKPYLLEINTRMSGGVQLSCVGMGVNIPAMALGRLMGRELPFSYDALDNRDHKVTYIETPLKLS